MSSSSSNANNRNDDVTNHDEFLGTVRTYLIMFAIVAILLLILYRLFVRATQHNNIKDMELQIQVDPFLHEISKTGKDVRALYDHLPPHQQGQIAALAYIQNLESQYS